MEQLENAPEILRNDYQRFGGFATRSEWRATVVEMIATERTAAIARTLEQELRDHDREAADVLRFAGAVVTQLTAAACAIVRRRSPDLSGDGRASA